MRGSKARFAASEKDLKSVLVREGVPILDLLNGSATGARGGRPRHELEFQAGAFKNGLGARVKVDWQSGSLARGLSASPAGGSGDLTFSNHASVRVNIFANLAERFGGAKAPDWLKGTRARSEIGARAAASSSENRPDPIPSPTR